MRRLVSILILMCFLVTGQIGAYPVYAQEISLPMPGARVNLSSSFHPAVLKGIKVYANDPFRFDFMVDQGDNVIPANSLKAESTKLIKYFLASLTTPEKDLWVNLSPYEKNRIIPDNFGLTQMGRDLLAQDYLLKQITSSLMYPESDLGRIFWKKIYAQAAERYGRTDITINTFNKVWIMPDEAQVYENGQAVYIVHSTLKVMLESDYLAQQHNSVLPDADTNTAWQKQLVREIIIPVLTKEINEGSNFAELRQVYNSLILSTWFKRRMKETLLGKKYADKNKITGIYDQGDSDPEYIYQQYLQAYKKGVYNYIKEEPDLITGQTIPRKYFSGGWRGEVNYTALSAEGFRHEIGANGFNHAMTVIETHMNTLDKAQLAFIPPSKDDLKEARAKFSQLLLRPRHHYWGADDDVLGKDLEGKYLGKTGGKGHVEFTVSPGYMHSMVVGPREKGLWVSFSKVRARGNMLEVTLKYEKADGTVLPERKFQIGRYAKELKNDVGKPLPVLIMEDQLAFEGLKEIMNRKKPPADWRTIDLPDMVGMELGGADTAGIYSFAVEPGFKYDWTGIGLDSSGWSGTIITQKAKASCLEFSVRFANVDTSIQPVIKTFQIGAFQKMLDGYGIQKGFQKSFLKISANLGEDAINQIITAPSLGVRRLTLDGLIIGTSNQSGTIPLSITNSLGEKFTSFLSFLGKDAANNDKKGWTGIVKKKKYKRHYVEIEVVFQKKDQPSIRRTYQISQNKTKLKNYATGQEFYVFDIEQRPGLEAIKHLMAQTQGPYTNLEGLLVGGIDADGRIILDFGHEAIARISPLGFQEGGWAARIIKHIPKATDNHEITLFFSKKGETGFTRKFQIGPEKQTISSDKGPKSILTFKAVEASRHGKIKRELAKRQKSAIRAEEKLKKKEYRKANLSDGERLRNDMLSLKKIKISPDEVLQNIIGEEVAKMTPLYAEYLFQESISAGGQVLQEVLTSGNPYSYDPTKHGDLVDYFRQQLRARVAGIVGEDRMQIGPEPESLSEILFSHDLNGERRQDGKEGKSLVRMKVESFDDLEQRLGLVKKSVDEVAEGLNGHILHWPQKKSMAEGFEAILRQQNIFDMLKRQGSPFAVYLAGQWGAWAFTQKDDPLKVVIAVNGEHNQLNRMAEDLARQLSWGVLNNNGTVNLKFDHEGRPVLVDVVSAIFPNSEEKESLMDVFANALIVHESPPGVLRQLAQQTFDALGEDATDEIFGHYESFLEQQIAIKKSLEKDSGEAVAEAVPSSAAQQSASLRGGIDFNPENIHLEYNKNAAMTAVFRNTRWSRVEINGLSPVIMGVTSCTIENFLTKTPAH